MPTNSASELAEAFLAFANEHGDLISNMKLQKLLYYAQGWYLALFDEPLFADRIEAWIHGPVVPAVWRHYQSFGFKPIESNATREDLPELPESVWDHIEEIWKGYGRYSGYDLVAMTQAETPWLVARRGLNPTEVGSNEVTVEYLTSFFKRERQLIAA